MPEPIAVENFIHGIVTRFESETIPRGAAEDALNWLTLGDRIELRRGQSLKGTNVSGNSPVTGMKVAKSIDGVQELIYTYDRKIRYFDRTAGDFAEAGSNTLPADASGEDVAIESYSHLAGEFFYLSSPNSSIYKIPLANLDSVIDLSSTDFRGKMRIKWNRMFLWDKKNSVGDIDKTGIFLSHIDKDEVSDYTQVTGESIGTGDGTTLLFTETLDFKAGDAKRNCFYVSVTDTVETFTDNRNGTLTGSAGGTGTINYATGAISVTFAVAPTNTQDITSDYYWENSTVDGIADFSFTTPTRAAGEGDFFRQDDSGGEFMNLGTINKVEYCLHEFRTWEMNITADDTEATNLPFKTKVGIPYWRAMEDEDDSIYYVHAPDQTEPAYKKMVELESNGVIKSENISQNLDLTNFRFNKAVFKDWGIYKIISCRDKNSTINNRMWVRHKQFGSWDLLDYRASILDELEGALIGGDSGSPNVFTLFDSFSDEESNIPNFYIFGKDNLDIKGIKNVGVLVLGGLIQPEQKLKVSISEDNGPFVEVGHTDEEVNGENVHTYTIEGDGAYVDQGAKISIGPTTLGKNEIGGGGTGVEASPYRREFRINTARFEYIRLKIEAVNIGYVSLTEYQWKDIRFKGQTLPSQYVVN